MKPKQTVVLHELIQLSPEERAEVLKEVERYNTKKYSEKMQFIDLLSDETKRILDSTKTEEKELMERVAAKRGVSVSTLIRLLVLDEAHHLGLE